ncbi:MAG: protein phosphatase 2C domain-containing protein [Anaerolineae bacterium]|nr:protein phosphatase 2C domain-containing protein [Anaerolineae bacterium]
MFGSDTPRTNGPQPPAWRVIGASVRGAAHVRSGLPNQDAICWHPGSGTGPLVILAVSDGHGSDKCFRSHVGARAAVAAAMAALQDFLDGLDESPNYSAVKRWAGENLPQQIVRRWRESVADDLLETPFTREELERLRAEVGGEKERQVVLDPVLAYGATLLSVLMTPAFTLYLQLGDGDILDVSESGEVSRVPLPADARLFANATTSLCSEEAWREFRSHFQVLSGAPPALILVSTDGYANSFRDEAGFLQVGSDILEMIRTQGLTAVQESLQSWLTEASQDGSGDDITLGILCRLDALEIPLGRVPAGQLHSAREEGGIVLARCSQNGQGFGIRLEEQGRGRWIADWAFAIDEKVVGKRAYGQGEVTGTFEFDAAYPGCPHCGAPSIFQCACGEVACWDGRSSAATCPWCGAAVQLRDPIGSLKTRADR